ncbi:MAG: response regulator [Halanaerobiales bacterium]|nr:response regulator [Halanaerobiales bacterium]
MKLLIVDDEVWSRMLIKKLLDWKALGFEDIYEANDGIEALETLNTTQIDLTITDMRMSGMDGAELLQQIRKNNLSTEVIVMSSYDHFKFLHEAIKTKAIDYILKPIAKQDLLQAVKTGINRIIQYNNHTTIEKILLTHDVKQELHTYFELKNNLFKALTEADETLLLETLNTLENELLKELSLSHLIAFIKDDLRQLIIKFQKEYDIKTDIDRLATLSSETLKDELTTILNKIKHINIHKQLEIIDVQKYIENHFSEPISLATVADTFHISKEHLGRLFKQEVGDTLQNYIINKRITYAKMLLKKHTNLNIATISVMSGYPDLQYFYRVFKRKTGKTPKQFKA